jgi:putative hydrolase of the HAD superfamily
MTKAILWDFDGTLAERPGRWGGCLLEVLDEHEPGHAVVRDTLRSFLRDGFPWHAPDIAHPELAEPDAWWVPIEALMARAYAGAGLAEARAVELARLARARYVDPTVGWRLFEDTVPALDALRAQGWRHVILSNHVPELDEIVAALGLGGLVDAVVSSARSGYEKPHPEAFAVGRAAAGDPDTLWMVGDNPRADVDGAEAAGIPAILVRTERGTATRWAATVAGVAEFLDA